MPTITVPEETYQRLSRRAAALAIRALDQLTSEPPANGHPADSALGEWLAQFTSWMAEVHARGPLYPPGHTVDVNREAMYDERV